MPKALLIDDSAFMRKILSNILCKAGYEIFEADNGTVAVEQYKLRRPDLVLLDIIIPPTNGIEILKQIKEIDPNANVIMCSSMGHEEIIMEAIDCGANDFIVKSTDYRSLTSLVEKTVSNSFV